MTEARDFWSRRRKAVAAEEAAVEAAADAARIEAEQAEKSEAEILEELNLPDPETLKPGDDFSAFMQKAVPEMIRRRALRVLWRSNPLLANVDMLVDYGEDFTDSANVVANLQTTYQVGKGMLKHVEKLAQDALASVDEGEAVDEDEAVEDVAEAPAVEVAPEPARTEPEVEIEEDAVAEAPLPTPRRMTFQIEETA